MTDTSFRDELEAAIGRSVGSGAVAPDPVNQPMIRHWVDALGDTNPMYTDPEFAARSRFGGIVGPPTMLQTWTMGRARIEGMGPGADAAPENPLTFLDEAGFVGTVATNSEFEIERYVRPGEVLSSTTVIEEISDEKRTGKGPGHFCTWLATYTVESGEVVGRQRFRILKFNPEA